MSRYVAVVIRDTKKYGTPSAHNLMHNLRIIEPPYLLKEERRLPNRHLRLNAKDDFPRAERDGKKWAREIWGHWVGEIERQAQLRAGRKLRTDAIKIEEGLIVLSHAHTMRLNAKEIEHRIMVFMEWFEQRHGTRVLSVDWHRDEGYYDEETGRLDTRNEHVHFLFENINEKGKTLRRTWDVRGYELSQMQDKIAEVFEDLGYERGTNYYRSPEPKPQHLAPRQYRQKKQIERQEKREKAAKKEIQKIEQNSENAIQRVWRLFARMRRRARKLRERLLTTHDKLMKVEREREAIENQLAQAILEKEEQFLMQNKQIAEASQQLSQAEEEKATLTKRLNEKDEALQNLQSATDTMERNYLKGISALESDLARYEDMEKEDPREEEDYPPSRSSSPSM